MHNMLLIAKREYLEQIRGRAFRLSTIGLPALFAVIIGIGYVASLGLGANKHLVILANDAALADAIRTQLLSGQGRQRPTWTSWPRPTPRLARSLIRQVQTKSIDGFLSVETPPGAAPKATYTAQSSGDFITNDRLKDALNNGMVTERLTASRHEPAQTRRRWSRASPSRPSR